MARYLSKFYFPGKDEEFDFFLSIKRKCYTDFYPFQVLSEKDLETIEFEPVTILYGGNGSGKTTALNIIGEKLGLQRDSVFNRSSFFESYTELCDYELEGDVCTSYENIHTGYIPKDSRIITSDDVFDFMLNLRTLNQGIDRKREDLFEEYLQTKYSKFQMNSLDDYEMLKKNNKAKSSTQSMYVKKSLMKNVREHSNGESAFRYFTAKIKDNGLYILDEPENSLSPERQKELARFIEDGARFFGDQFIIATHSPFMLAIKDAKVYDLDSTPCIPRKWTELPNVRAYYDFFKENEKEF